MSKDATFKFTGKDNISEALKTINQNIQKVTKATKDAAKAVNGFNLALTVIKAVINGVIKIVSLAVKSIISIVKAALKTLRNIITGLFKFIKTAMTTLLSWITKALGKVFNGIKKLFTNIFNFAKEVVNKTIQVVKKGIQFIIDSVQAYADKQYNEIQLKVSLGDSYDAVMQSYKELSRYTTANKNELLSVYAMFAEVGKSPEEILKYSKATVYVAQATGRSLDQIARLFLRQEAAGSDLERTLKRIGINISDQETSVKEIDRIIENLGPEMEALATGSLSQAFANIKNNITAFKENLGQVFSGPIKKIADKIDEITKTLSEGDLSELASRVDEIFDKIWKKIEPIFDFIRLALKYPEMLNEIKKALEKGGEDLIDSLLTYAKWGLVYAAAFAFDLLKQAVTNAFGVVKNKEFWNDLDTTIGGVLNDIGAALNITGFAYNNQKLVKNTDGTYSLPNDVSFAGYTDIRVDKNDDGTITIYDEEGKELGNFTVDAKGYAHLVFDPLNIDYTNFAKDSSGRYIITTPIYGYTNGILFDSDNLKAYDMDGNPITDLDVNLNEGTVTITPKNGVAFKLVLGENGGNISPETKQSIGEAVDKYWEAVKELIEKSWNEKAVVSLMPNLQLANPELDEDAIKEKYMIDLIGDDASPWYRNLMSLLSGLWDGVIKPDIIDKAWSWIESKTDWFVGLAKYLGDVAGVAINNAVLKSEWLRKLLSAVGIPLAVSSDQEYAGKAVSKIKELASQGWVHATSAMEVLGSMSIKDFTPEFLKSKANVKHYKGTWLQYLLEFGGLLGEDYNHLNRLGRADYISTEQAWPNITDYLPHYAKGGLVTKPTIALIGEAGPELIIPNDEIPKLDNGTSPEHGIFGFNFKGAGEYAQSVADGFFDLTKAVDVVGKTTQNIYDIFHGYLKREEDEKNGKTAEPTEELSEFEKWMQNSKIGKALIFQSKILVGVSKVVETLGSSDFWNDVLGVIKAPFTGDFWKSVGNFFKTNWYKIIEGIGDTIDTLIKGSFKGVGILAENGAFGTHVGNIYGKIKDDINSEEGFSLWKALGHVIEELLPYLEKGLEVVGSLFDEAFGILGNVVQILAERLGKVLLPILEAFIPFMKVLADIVITLTPVVESILKPAVAVIAAVLQVLVPILELFMTVLMPIVAVLQTVFEAITWAVNSFLNWLSDINIFGWRPFGGIKKRDPGTVHSVKENYESMKATWDEARATSANSVGTSASVASQTASYSGASVIHVHNDFSGAYVVGTNGFRELALIIKNTLEDLEYSGQTI